MQVCVVNANWGLVKTISWGYRSTTNETEQQPKQGRNRFGTMAPENQIRSGRGKKVGDS